MTLAVKAAPAADSDGSEMPRPGGERAHQHLPALADLVDAADDVVHRNEDVLAPVRAVLEHVHRRQMAAADADAGQVGRHQRERDADVVALADQVIGIAQLEGEAQHGRDRAERDVALVPVQPDAERLLALEGAAADHAVVDHRGGVRSGLRAGQAEAGDFLAAGKPRQPVVLLRLGAELISSSPGPSEFGTIAVTAAEIERDDSLRITSECA